jgi:MYXO-CTERM domain-containing protein
MAMVKSVLSVCITVLSVGEISRAAVISEWAGSGADAAYVVLNFSDGADYAFGVRFDGTTTGLAAVQALESQTGLDVMYQDFGWGVFVDGFSYGGHSDSGYQGGENWWHYWVSDDGQNWTSPGYGASDRIVMSGVWDGWVYGSAEPPQTPVPEPVTATLLVLGAGLRARRRRR